MSAPDHFLTPSEIFAKPAFSWTEFWSLLGLPESTAEEIVREPNGPRFFMLGRRRYIRKADALAWIDLKAKSAPYIPRQNNRKGAAGK